MVPSLRFYVTHAGIMAISPMKNTDMKSAKVR